jgi:hypothetical protein
MRCSIPVIHAGFFRSSRALSPTASTIADAPSVIGAMSWRRRGSAKNGRSSSSSMLFAGFSESVRSDRERVERDLRHLLGRPLAAVQAEAGLQSRHRHRVRPQRRDRVRVGLKREHPAQGAGGGLAEAVDERGVDLSGQQLDVGLIKRPRGVHLHVRLVDRRHRPDRVDRGDKRKGAAGKVIR